MRASKDHDDRYAYNWSTTAKKAHSATNGRCCWCKVEKSAEVHHTYYWFEGQAIAGKEKPGRDVFPVCSPCHLDLHLPCRWAQVFDPWARENIPSAIETLRANFKELKNAEPR